MCRSVDETRRGFLKRLARAAAFVPPALVTLKASRAEAQGQPAHAGRPTPKKQTEGQFQADPSLRSDEESQPWDPGRGAGTPPWARPPPTAAGGGT